MLKGLDIFRLQTNDEIEQIYIELNKNLMKYNNQFFHFNDTNLFKYLKNPLNSIKYRFNKFTNNWENFNNHKQLLYHWFEHGERNQYPSIFDNAERICIADITIDYQQILEEINVLKINKQVISYAYIQIITKLVKEIIYNKVLSEFQILYCQVDILNNIIDVQYKNTLLDKVYDKQYKLNKFLYKYQKIYPDQYKQVKAKLIISKNWQDIFLSSTFKQWISCMNLINTYKDHKIKYSNENYVKSGGLIAYLILDLNDGKTINEIMNDNGFEGLCYQRTIWRCHIKRLVNQKNKNDYLFLSENTTYRQ